MLNVEVTDSQVSFVLPQRKTDSLVAGAFISDYLASQWMPLVVFLDEYIILRTEYEYYTGGRECVTKVEGRSSRTPQPGLFQGPSAGTVEPGVELSALAFARARLLASCSLYTC